MKIKSIIEFIRVRPSMFAGSFENLRDFLQGFYLRNKLNDEEESIDSKFIMEFDVWVKDFLSKQNHSDAETVKQLQKSRTYIQAIQIVEKEEKLQFSKFFNLYDLYIEERINKTKNNNKINFYQYILLLEEEKENISFQSIRGLIDGFRMNLVFQYFKDKYSEEFKKFYNWIIEYIQQNYNDENILKQICSGRDYIYHISLIKEEESEQKELFFELVKKFFDNCDL